MEKLAGDWWESGSWWQFAITISAGLLVGALGAWAAIRSANPRRKINWWIQSNTPLFNRPAGDGALLNVSLGNTRLTNPRVVELVISNPGDRDVTPPMFHEAKPIKFDFDAVAAVLHVATDPANALLPEITPWQEIIRGTGGRHKGGLLIEPAHLRRGQTITVTVLIDGEEKPVRCVQFPLIDVEQSNVRPGSLSRETANALDGASLYIGPFRIRVGR